MATLDSLKSALRGITTKNATPGRKSLADDQYSAGFDILVHGSGRKIYQDFIIPQLTQLLASLLDSRTCISILEIGPGPKSVIGYLPPYLRRKIRKYTTFEPNSMFATRLEEWLNTTSEKESPLPCLESLPEIYREPFGPNSNTRSGEFDVVLFCHSMYGMKPKERYIQGALDMLVKSPAGGMVVIFHRKENLNLDGLVCHRTACFPTGVIQVANNDQVLDCFACFIAGFVFQDVDIANAVRVEWRKVCRTLGHCEGNPSDHLFFSAPEVMVAFTQHATTIAKLKLQVPSVMAAKSIKNCNARAHCPTTIVQPTEVQHVQQCVQWAISHGLGLTVVGGGHSGHCQWPNVVAVDMSAFDQIYIVSAENDTGKSGYDSDTLLVAESGCKTEDIVRKSMAMGITVPLGGRPSVGAGLWLQGGIGHLSRLYGLACDTIIGAVVVSVSSSQILIIGSVPIQHRPAGSVQLREESELLWAIRGAGTNFGIVISVTFKAFTAPSFAISNWVIPLNSHLDARRKLSDFDTAIAKILPRNCSADAYLYWNTNQLHLGVTLIESYTAIATSKTRTPISTLVNSKLGPEKTFKIVDGVGMFETEMYMSEMHGGHGGGKTSSFKRCLFLKQAVNVADILIAAMDTRPSPLCYLHLLQGGGAIGDIAADTTAFGCRDWEFACVVTAVWPRGQDGTETARAAVSWVYAVVGDLLPLSGGVYGADLGPDPRDTVLATQAFGPNLPRLAGLKKTWDPCNVLAYACPLPKAPTKQKLIVLVTGESCAGKDYCAEIWASVFANESITARPVSISDAIKREYAVVAGADLNRLLRDRHYKEQHRPALTTFFQEQVRQQPQLPKEQFLNVVHGANDVDVLLISGMRDKAPVATLSHLVPNSRVLEICVRASKETQRVRRGCNDGYADFDEDNIDNRSKKNNISSLKLPVSHYQPSLFFDNDTTGNDAAKNFARYYLLPFFDQDLERLSRMVPSVSDFPRTGIEFRHVLNISQQPRGLALCTSLLKTHFYSDWAKVDVVACCEAGGFVFASALAAKIDIPLVLIRGAGKLSPPVISVTKSPSHISSALAKDAIEETIEMGRDVVPRGASVVVVDDVLATGETLCAVLQLLHEAGVGDQNINVMVVAEFPIHRGRELLYQRGFGKVNIQSLLVFETS